MKITIFLMFSAGIIAAVSCANKPSAQNTVVNTVSAEQSASDNPRIKHFRLAKGNVAIDGYDPVSYFKDGPKKGSESRSYDYKGIVYHFASAENLNEFKTNPDKYEPVWGGWCGHAMAKRGEKVEINPECYKIVNGRNVLFFKTFYANALTNWEKELKTTPENTLMMAGDEFWGKTIQTGGQTN